MKLSSAMKSSRILFLVNEFNKKILNHPHYQVKKSAGSTCVIFHDSDLCDFYPICPSPDGWGLISEEMAEVLCKSEGESTIKQFERKTAVELAKSSDFLSKSKSEVEHLLLEMIEVYLEKYEYFLEFYHPENHAKLKENFEILVEKCKSNPEFILSHDCIIDAIEKEIKNNGSISQSINENADDQTNYIKLAAELKTLKDCKKFTVSDICSKLDIKKSQYYQILRNIKSGNLPIFDHDKAKPIKTYLKSPELMLFKSLADDPTKSYTAKEMKSKLFENFGTDISVGNIYYHLHNTFGYSLKRNRYKPPLAFTQEQKILDFQVCKELLNFGKNQSELICIDESSATIGIQRERSFSKIGKAAYRIGYTKCEPYNLTMAISKNKIFAYQIRKDSNNEITFVAFIIELVNKILSFGPQFYTQVYLFLDNAPHHKSSLMLELLGILNISVCFSSPNNSNLNPIENCFGLIKGELKSHQNISAYFY